MIDLPMGHKRYEVNDIPIGRLKGGHDYHQSQKLKEYIRAKYSYTCQLCHEPGDVVDHIIPWAISHDSSISNLRVLCKPCNLRLRKRRKVKLPLNEWYEALKAQLKADFP